MGFFPYERFTADLPVPPQVALERLRRATGRRAVHPDRSLPFAGEVGEESFRVHPVRVGRTSSFVPDVHGFVFEGEVDGRSRVTATMTLHPPVVALLAASAAIYALLLSFPELRAEPGVWALGVAAVAMTLIGWWWDAGPTRRRLIAVMSATPSR